MTKSIYFNHVASFQGNVGDNASHRGLYDSWSKNTGWVLSPEQVEIRRAYENYQSADKLSWPALIEQTEASKKLRFTWVGGGNFFTPRLASSPTGTTVGLPSSSLAALKKPLIFHAVGFDHHLGYEKKCVELFREFVLRAIDSKRCLFFCRNDGSKRNLMEIYGEEFTRLFSFCPDPGFFYRASDRSPFMRPVLKRPYIAINLAMDMLKVRFPRQEEYQRYCQELAHWLESMAAAEQGFFFYFVPHIWSDLRAIYDVLDLVHEKVRRSRVLIAGFDTEPGCEERTFSIYADAALVVGNRFHTNVCSIAMEVPTIGLPTYIKLRHLYHELELQDCLVDVFQPNFAAALVEKCQSLWSARASHSKRLRQINCRLQKQASTVHCQIAEFLLPQL